MTDILKTFIWAVTTELIGWSVLSIILYRRSLLFRIEKLALSFPLGLGLVSMEMAVLPVFRIEFGIVSIMAVWIPVILAGLFFTAKNVWGGCCCEAPRKRPFTFLEKFLIAGISFEVFYAFFRALIKPIESYDAIAIYAIKSKIFYIARTIPPNFFSDFRNFVPHVEYPLALPLAETYFYTFIGSLQDILVKVIFPLYYIAVLAIFYCMVRRGLERKASILFTFLLAAIPQFKDYATNGYADILLAFYYSASLFYLLLWMKKKETPLLVLSFILSAMAIWTKTEGLMLTGINLLLVLIYMAEERSRFRQGIVFISLTAVSIAAYLYLKKILGLGIHSDFAKVNYSNPLKLAANIKRIPLILYEYQIQFLGPKKWNIIWILFMAGIILNFKRILSKDMKFLTLAILAVFLGYTSIYLMTPLNVSWHISTTASRFFIHFLPPVLLWLSMVFKEMKIEI